MGKCEASATTPSLADLKEVTYAIFWVVCPVCPRVPISYMTSMQEIARLDQSLAEALASKNYRKAGDIQEQVLAY